MQRTGINPRTLAVTAVMTAVVFVLTGLVRVPTPARGYIHLGDAAIFFSAFAFGPWVGAVAGGLGTGLADVAGGYPQWAVFSLLIHGAQGWVVGWASEKWPGLAGLVVSAIVGGVVVVAGYLGAGILLMGTAAALGELPMNILQVGTGAVIGILLFLAVRRAYPPIANWDSRHP
jgi:uncharacterized membrane protein